MKRMDWIGLACFAILGIAHTFEVSSARADGLPGFSSAMESGAKPREDGAPKSPNNPRSIPLQQIFVVTEKHPITGEVVGMPKRFQSRLEAATYREKLSEAMWVVWRYAGAEEPLRAIRFENQQAAERFIASGGPSRKGILGSFLTAEAPRLLSARVILESEFVRP